jgi:hypothetical protein
MRLFQRITQVLQQRKIMQEHMKDRRALSRQRLEAICESPAGDDGRVVIFSGAKRI